MTVVPIHRLLCLLITTIADVPIAIVGPYTTVLTVFGTTMLRQAAVRRGQDDRHCARVGCASNGTGRRRCVRPVLLLFQEPHIPNEGWDGLESISRMICIPPPGRSADFIPRSPLALIAACLFMPIQEVVLNGTPSCDFFAATEGLTILHSPRHFRGLLREQVLGQRRARRQVRQANRSERGHQLYLT